MGTRKLTPKSTPIRSASEKGGENETGEGSRSRAVDKGTEGIRNQLVEHIGALRFVTGTISVCVQALQQQDADMDREIAQVLQRTAGDKLDETADRLEALAVGIEYQEV